MEHHFFAYINRMKFIQRWGLMRNTLPENDMEHALQTAMIAHAIGNSPTESENASRIAPAVSIIMPPRHVYCPMTTPRNTSAAMHFPPGKNRMMP